MINLIDYIDFTDTYSDFSLGNIFGRFFGEEPLGELWKTQKSLLGTLDKLTSYRHEGLTGSHTRIRRL